MEEETVNSVIEEISKRIGSLDSGKQLEVLKYLEDPSSIGSTNKLGSTGLTVGDAEIMEELAAQRAKTDTEAYLGKLEGYDPNKQGIAGFQKRDLSARDKDRWLTGGMAVADMLQRMALIQQL